MAKILAFRTGESRHDRGEGREARGGEVILFPGVRYERWRDEASDDRDASKRRDTRRERDILELAE
jgi:hypothetical protein